MSRELPYIDPVDQIWLGCARRLGITVVRSDEVFASWDGVDTLTISTPEGFDPDDSLAQMILHELCHALVESPDGLTARDWGLENIDQRDLVREHACHRLQARLLTPHGLRALLGPTTEHRPYYDALPPDPLSDGDDPAIGPAREGYSRSTSGPWAQDIAAALKATAAIAAVVAPFADGTLWAVAEGC
ncbi:MAG: hypothetical protein ACI8RZ_002057 [Myxococcota bacterium]|jgi:hypothetical protein